MIIKSVGFSITIPSLAAEAPECAALAGVLQTSMGADRDVVVTREEAWTECAKLSVFVRNVNATPEAIGPLVNSFRLYTAAVLAMNAYPPGERMHFRRSRCSPGVDINVALEWMEEQTIKFHSKNPRSARPVSPDLTTDPLSTWNKTRPAMLSFLAGCARATRSH